MNDARAFFRLLDELGVASRTDEHEAVHTADGLAGQDGAAAWEFPVKNILVEDKDRRLFLVTMRLDTPPLDLKALARDLGASGRFSFAKPETLGAALGVTPGSVTPFAVFNDRERRVRVVLDERLKDAKTISAHPLVNTMTTTIAIAGLLTLFSHTGHRPLWRPMPLKSPSAA
jgi:Ala-tRNA(Pro) deacylase